MDKRWFWKEEAVTLLMELVGSFMVSIALYNFAAQAEFPMTGFSGLALILYRLFDLPIGVTTILMNVPVALLCYKLLGRAFFLRSVRCMLISSLMVDYLAPLLPVYTGDRLLAAICTGVLGGFGYALIYVRGSSTGGSDFITMAVKAARPHLSLGFIVMALDMAIVLLGGAIFRDMDGIIYGCIISYIYSLAVDKLMYGMNAGKLALIVTAPESGGRVSQAIQEACDRGVTLLNGRGGYTNEDKAVVMCACSNKQMIQVERAVRRVEPAAFIIILSSHEVLGEGFIQR